MDRATARPVLIGGYYGFGNLGDEAVLAGLLGELRSRVPSARPVVLSADPPGTRLLHGVEAMPRTPSRVWQALAGARLLIMGGGSLVQDVTSARSALYYLGTMLAADRRGVPVAAVGQGIGPIRRRWVQRLTARAFEAARVISVRDRDSLRALEALGVSRPVHLGADLSVLLSPAPREQVEAVLRGAGLEPGRPTVAAAVRPWPGLADPEVLGGILRRCTASWGASVAVLVFDRRRDQAASDAVARASGGRVIAASTPQELLGLVGAMHLVVGVRFHAIVFAAAWGVPAIGLAYDPKVSAFMTEQGLQGLLPVDASPGELVRALEAAWTAPRMQPAALQARLEGWRRAAAAGIAAAAGLLVD
ncbi:MAG: polysaccharide pyruvyl transferase CsaB [Armatimonadota bacterium]|nr:polysaccharide pyruvyl transferase CsaB [Armatimonadota bacterium]MDR7520450.1 polysaccharide pyruvyl transferase CsaB [Armatimonadota bacterium]